MHIKCLDECLALYKWQCIEYSPNYNQGNALLQSLKEGSQQGIPRAAFSHSTRGYKNEPMGIFPPQHSPFSNNDRKQVGEMAWYKRARLVMRLEGSILGSAFFGGTQLLEKHKVHFPHHRF